MTSQFYAKLSYMGRPFYVSMTARTLAEALAQVQAFISGYAACGGAAIHIDSISATTQRSVEYQDLLNYVSIPG